MIGASSRSIAGRCRLSACLAALTVALLTATWPTLAQAGRERSYCFLLSEIQLAEGIPAEVADVVRKQLGQAIAAHARLSGALPEGAPDPLAQPKAFARYAKRHKLAVYRVSVEVTRYHHEVEPAPRGKGQRLGVSIDLHLFGEAIPQRAMAFSGDGSATVKLEIGKRLRPRDSEFAQQEAATEAVADALTTSIQRLDEKSRGGNDGKKK